MENFVCIFSKTKGHPGDHVKMVHEGILIICGLRSFGLTFRTSRFARQVPQLAALALHTAGFTVRPKLVWLALLYMQYNFYLA